MTKINIKALTLSILLIALTACGKAGTGNVSSTGTGNVSGTAGGTAGADITGNNMSVNGDGTIEDIQSPIDFEETSSEQVYHTDKDVDDTDAFESTTTTVLTTESITETTFASSTISASVEVNDTSEQGGHISTGVWHPEVDEGESTEGNAYMVFTPSYMFFLNLYAPSDVALSIDDNKIHLEDEEIEYISELTPSGENAFRIFETEGSTYTVIYNNSVYSVDYCCKIEPVGSDTIHLGDGSYMKFMRTDNDNVVDMQGMTDGLEVVGTVRVIKDNSLSGLVDILEKIIQ